MSATPQALAGVGAGTLARYFQVLSDVTRLRIIDELHLGERNVSQLVAATGGTQSGVSNHLACLRWCGFVASRRSGREIFYSLADPVVALVVATVRQELAGDREIRLDACHTAKQR
jgi:DNA-binding transcriptional ArsR family regulator